MRESRVLVQNRKAFHEYTILETLECGISLLGPEVKSLLDGRGNLKESYVMIRGGEIFLVGAHISPYPHAHHDPIDPERDRKLLMHKQEIERWQGKVREKGLTIVPLKIYLKAQPSRIKIEIALAKGKRLYDKREAIKKRELSRERHIE
jgi:SsrA-binding protein